MGADIKVYNITELECEVLYKGIHYSVWKDPYSCEIFVFDTGRKYIGWSLSGIASFDAGNLKESFSSQSFIDTFVSNMLFDDFKFLGCQRIFARKGDEFCVGEDYQRLINKQGVYYENGRYIYVKTDSEGHVIKSLIFNSENDMYSVIKDHNKIDLSKTLNHIGGKASSQRTDKKPEDDSQKYDEVCSEYDEEIEDHGDDAKRRDDFVNMLDEVSRKMEEAGQLINNTGKKVVNSSKKVVKTSIKSGKKVAAKSLLAGALVLSTAAAGTIYLHEKPHKKK